MPLLVSNSLLKYIVVIFLRPVHSIRCSFTNVMARWEPVGAICWPSNSGSGEKDGPEFIRCVDRRQPKIHKVWTFGEDGITSEVHPTARVDVSAFIGGCFASDYLTPTWRRIPMFGRNYINESVDWLGVPNFLSNDGPPWTLNLLGTYAN